MPEHQLHVHLVLLLHDKSVLKEFRKPVPDEEDLIVEVAVEVAVVLLHDTESARVSDTPVQESVLAEELQPVYHLPLVEAVLVSEQESVVLSEPVSVLVSEQESVLTLVPVPLYIEEESA